MTGVQRVLFRSINDILYDPFRNHGFGSRDSAQASLTTWLFWQLLRVLCVRTQGFSRRQNRAWSRIQSRSHRFRKGFMTWLLETVDNTPLLILMHDVIILTQIEAMGARPPSLAAPRFGLALWRTSCINIKKGVWQRGRLWIMGYAILTSWLFIKHQKPFKRYVLTHIIWRVSLQYYV